MDVPCLPPGGQWPAGGGGEERRRGAGCPSRSILLLLYSGVSGWYPPGAPEKGHGGDLGYGDAPGSESQP